VRINDQEGTVTEMGAFTTRIRTGLGEELILPNALVMASVTKNYSRAVKGRGFVVDTTVTIGYDTPWRQVESLLTEAARRTLEGLRAGRLRVVYPRRMYLLARLVGALPPGWRAALMAGFPGKD
jgi:small-conductance mechanosensitive channel